MRIFIIILTLLITQPGITQIRLPKLISNHMVLQRDTPLKLWGRAKPGEKISLRFNKKTYRVTTGGDGVWFIPLAPQPAGGPHEMTFSAGNTLTVRDIFFGDVWLCAGQSNMVLPMERVKEKYFDEIASADLPMIRNFFVPPSTNLSGPGAELPSQCRWIPANPKDVLSFGAVSYFFARKIYETQKVPVGIINTSVGGTPIEAWIPEEGFREFPEMLSRIEKNKDSAYVNSTNREVAASRTETPSHDKGMSDPVKWYEAAYIPKGWRTINIPGFWEDQGLKDLNGVVWYRREVNLPDSLSGLPAKIFMGRIVDADIMYVNGQKIGNITYQFPPRRYDVPAGLLKGGKNILVIRVTNTSNKGGFVPDKPYQLNIGSQQIDLKGTWMYKVGEAFVPPPPRTQGIIAQNQPSALYNGMVAPMLPFKVKGMIWYQGESNTDRPERYEQWLRSLIMALREKLQQTEAPFLFVQLANFMDYAYLPTESNWARLRDNQRRALTVPNTAMIVTTDAGEWNDIHPLDKKTVGERLSLAARALAYGEKIIYAGPLVESAIQQGENVVISFQHTGSGLITNDAEPLRCFAIAAADKKFLWAQARIDAGRVIVSHPEIRAPKYIRYNWGDNPDGNLYNREGLPASGFEVEVR